MATTATLTSATEAYAVQAQIAAAAVLAAQRLRKPTAEQIALLVAAYQLLAAQQGSASIAPMLAEQGLSTATVGTVATQALSGITSAGYPLSTMFEAVQSGAQLSMLVASTIQDASRNGASLQMAVTPSATSWVRMLNPPSCSRCIILAGRKYPNAGGRVFKWVGGKWIPEHADDGAFERHPQCDCTIIPVSEDTAGDIVTDPMLYFESLSREDQDRTFGAAGAEAIRDGADIFQVVNARRGGGVRKAQIFGHKAFHTLEGVTKRGVGHRAMGPRRSVRLMPESIYALAKDRADAIRLLRLYGWIF